MKSIELKGNVGDKVLIEAVITGIRIEEDGVTFCVQTEPDADIVELKDSEVREIEKAAEPKVKREKVKSTLSEVPRKKPGRPKKSETAAEEEKKEIELEKAPGVIGVGRPRKRATVQSTLAKYEAMKAMEGEDVD